MIPKNLYIVNLRDKDANGNFDSLQIQNIPIVLGYDPSSSWKTIASIGRNNPFYHYVGSEDTLTFELDWYVTQNNREDVITKCKWVESLSKADAYDEPPPTVLLIFGAMFKGYTWIVESAPYELELFQPGHRLLPHQAYQRVTLKRVTDKNLSTREVKEWR